MDAAEIKIKHMSANIASIIFRTVYAFTLHLNNWTFGSLFITRKSCHAHNFRYPYLELDPSKRGCGIRENPHSNLKVFNVHPSAEAH